MSDLGFGVVDRRSVIVVFMTFVLSLAVFGNALPIDTTTALDVFLGVVIMTGFIYGARVVARLLIVVPAILFYVPTGLRDEIAWRKNNRDGTRKSVTLATEAAKVVLSALKDSVTYGTFGVLMHDQYTVEEYPQRHIPQNIIGFVSAADRVVLIAIAYAATLPQLSVYVRWTGLIGMALLVAVYIFTGSFTFIIMDASQRAELQQRARDEALRHAASHPSIYGTVTTKPEIRDYGP